MSTRLDDHWK